MTCLRDKQKSLPAWTATRELNCDGTWQPAGARSSWWRRLTAAPCCDTTSPRRRRLVEKFEGKVPVIHEGDFWMVRAAAQGRNVGMITPQRHSSALRIKDHSCVAPANSRAHCRPLLPQNDSDKIVVWLEEKFPQPAMASTPPEA